MDPVQTLMDIAELFLIVLSHLPADALPRFRMVSRYWNDTITEAADFRTNLFLGPIPAYRRLIWAQGTNRNMHTPMIRVMGEPGFRDGVVIAAVHPQLVHTSSMQSDNSRLELQFPSLGQMLSWPENAKCLEALLTQPLCTVIRLVCPMLFPHQGHVRTIVDPWGLRMSKVVKRMREATQTLVTRLARDGQQSKLDQMWIIGTIQGYVGADSECVIEAEKRAKWQRQNDHGVADQSVLKIDEQTERKHEDEDDMHDDGKAHQYIAEESF